MVDIQAAAAAEIRRGEKRRRRRRKIEEETPAAKYNGVRALLGGHNQTYSFEAIRHISADDKVISLHERWHNWKLTFSEANDDDDEDDNN